MATMWHLAAVEVGDSQLTRFAGNLPCATPWENEMARRRLLTGGERQRLFDPPADESAIIGHYTLSPEDMELAGRRYGPANRLGLAAHIALMRHPGFGL